MNLGILSDTHDDTARTDQALARFREAEVARVLHLGDLTSPGTLASFAGLRVHLVRGNMDRDEAGIREAAAALDPPAVFDVVQELHVGGKRVGMIHGDDAARLEGMIQSGAFDLVLHGHTHVFRDERAGGTRVVNPGAVHRAREPSVCLYEPSTDTLERIRL